VINVAGHRIGTMEVESALVAHPKVAEAAVIGMSHEIKGQALAAFVTLKEGNVGDGAMVEELRGHVADKIGAIAKPDRILFTAELPKTRSGKIMRRLLRDIAEAECSVTPPPWLDSTVVQSLKERYEERARRVGAHGRPALAVWRNRAQHLPKLRQGDRKHPGDVFLRYTKARGGLGLRQVGEVDVEDDGALQRVESLQGLITARRSSCNNSTVTA
jgi:hypothetical protein